jgi:hypothetical protein
MQGESQPKLNSPTCLGEAEFDCKYPELVYLIYLAIFILKLIFFLRSVSVALTLYVSDPQQQPVLLIYTASL